MEKTTSYVLSKIAAADVSSIYDYTSSEHGSAQAAKYLEGLEQTLISLSERPGLGRARTEIRKDLHSFLYEKHTIFYRIMPEQIRIIRILHARRDMPRWLKGE